MGVDAFEMIQTAVQKDIDAGEPIYVLEKSDSDFVIVDDTMNRGRAIRYCHHDKITANWLEERILISSTAKQHTHSIDPCALAEYLSHAVDRNILQTLEYIVIVADAEQDWDEFFPVLEDRHGNPILEVCALPDEGQLGISWVEYQIVVVNLEEIVATAKVLCADMFSDFETEVNIGVLTTVLHELFHLAQNDPYVSEEVFDGLPKDVEEQAETWAINTFEEYGGYILKEKNLQ